MQAQALGKPDPSPGQARRVQVVPLLLVPLARTIGLVLELVDQG